MNTIEIKDINKFYNFMDMSAEAAEADDNLAYKEVMRKTNEFITRMTIKYESVTDRNSFLDAADATERARLQEVSA